MLPSERAERPIRTVTMRISLRRKLFFRTMPSYAKGPDAQLIEQTIYEILVATAARLPSRDALIVRHQNIRLSWAQFLEETDRLAGALTAMGLVAGDRIG